MTILRKQKIDCERRLQDQEEELDELAGQVQLLEQAKLRLEMTLESMRKEAKKEAQLREEEVEEARCNAQKKVKGKLLVKTQLQFAVTIFLFVPLLQFLFLKCLIFLV